MLLDKQLIRQSVSPWAFPVTCVPKKDGGQRMVVDYRKLNIITIDDQMPIPNINHILDRMSGAKYFSTLDIAWGFWHIEMDPASIEKTAFVTNEGHYEWLVMPFGLSNAPRTFQRIIQQTLGNLLYNGCINYQDDIIIYSKTFDEHMRLLSDIFQRMRQNNIKLKLAKCSFAKESIDYLGHTIRYNSVAPSTRKVEAVHNFPVPTTVTEVRRFLGLAGYMRRFIKSFSSIAAPLTDLLKKERDFKWTNEHQTAFETLKTALTSAPVLAIYDNSRPCNLYTDASKLGIGAVLTQGEKGDERPIAYFSQRMNHQQANYSASELECFAVVRAIDHFEVYLDKPFKLYTDHSALKWLFNHRKPTGKLFRWSIALSAKSFEIIHRPGSTLAHADALSRAFPVLHLEIDDLKAAQRDADLSFLRKPINHDGYIKIIRN